MCFSGSMNSKTGKFVEKWNPKIFPNASFLIKIQGDENN